MALRIAPPPFKRRFVGLVRRVFGRADAPFNPRRPTPVSIPMVEPDIASLKAEYAAKRLDQEPDTFVLYRIIGNDLYPRHQKGQSYDNVRFILENEPQLANCEKRWVVNRIFDPEQETSILKMLDEREQTYIRLAFDWNEYARVPWNFESFPQSAFFLRGAFAGMDEYDQILAETQLRRHKNNYVMNNNGARNVALRDGRGRAKWVLPWDGNCYLTKTAWEDMVAAITERPYFKYFVVPMARITDNECLLDSCRPEAKEEPQIVFRRDAREEFNESFPYGRRPKVELLWRLGVPGGWDRWGDDVWDPPRRGRSEEAGQFGYAGWVARLFSGQPHLENAAKRTIRDRGLARMEAIRTTLDFLDDRAFRLRFNRKTTTAYAESSLDASRLVVGQEGTGQRLVAKLREEADAALKRGPYSVMHKTTLPPSGDPHDYWHPAPYWWPNPKTSDGLPFIRRDGKRVPGTHLYEPDSDKYDRTRLQGLFDDTTVLSLAWKLTGETTYAEHAATLVRHWFITPKSRMNPHLRYAQVRLGHDDSEGSHTGVIEMKDFYYFLDAVRFLEQAGALLPSDHAALDEWLRQYRDWLATSRQGMQERRANNNHGTCYDLQTAAIDAYLGNVTSLLSTFRTSQERLLDQFEQDGSQPHEMERTLTGHYCCFNLQSWVNLATLGERCGFDLWSITAADGRSLRRAFEWMAPYIGGREWDWPQTDSLDCERFIPLYFACRDHYGGVAGLDSKLGFDRLAAKPIFFPHDGIKPFWMLG
jgi:Alginate lyase